MRHCSRFDEMHIGLVFTVLRHVVLGNSLVGHPVKVDSITWQSQQCIRRSVLKRHLYIVTSALYSIHLPVIATYANLDYLSRFSQDSVHR